MPSRPAQLRSLASSDIDDAVTSLTKEAGALVAGEFVDALEQAVRHITRSPNSGTLRFAYELGIPELRAWGVKRFPYAIFYIPKDDRIDIWRVLHIRRDVPSSF